jgi:hypothetical protein
MSDDVLTSGGESRRSWSRIIDDLLAMYAMRDNWDGLGAEAPGSDLLRSTIDLVCLLKEEPEIPVPSRIIPTPIGTVLLEWQTARQYLEWEVTRPYTAECMSKESGKPARHWTFDWCPAHTDQGMAFEHAVLSQPATQSGQSIASEQVYIAA